MHNMLKCLSAMFPDREVSHAEDGADVSFGEAEPAITAEQVATLARIDPALVLSFRDDSRRYESCTIIDHVLHVHYEIDN